MNEVKKLTWAFGASAKRKEYWAGDDDLKDNPAIDIRAGDYKHITNSTEIVFKGANLYLNVVDVCEPVPVKVKLILEGSPINYTNLHAIREAEHIVELRRLIARFNFAHDRAEFDAIYDAYKELEHLLTQLYVENSNFVFSDRQIINDYRANAGLTIYDLFVAISKCIAICWPAAGGRPAMTSEVALYTIGGKTSVVYNI